MKSRAVQCTESFDALRFIPFDSIHRFQIPDFNVGENFMKCVFFCPLDELFSI
jgi:hypothetical protein